MTPREHRLQSQEIRLRERELALRHWQSREAAAARIADAGFRSLLMMNGVGVLALGAFLASTIPVPEAEDFVPSSSWPSRCTRWDWCSPYRFRGRAT